MTNRQPLPPANPFDQLPATGRDMRRIHAIVDTLGGGWLKYKCDEELGVFRLKRGQLAHGMKAFENNQ